MTAMTAASCPEFQMRAPCDSRAKDNCIFVNLVNQTSLSSITFTAPLAPLFRKGSPVRRIIFEVVLGLLFLAAAGFGGWTWMQKQEMEAALGKATTTAGEAEAKTNALTAERDAAQQRIPDLLQKEALLDAATSGSPKFFLGTDSAPHAKHLKEHSCGCAGVYSAHAGIELYAEAFDAAGALHNLEVFASLNGPAFYGLPPNNDTITLQRRSWSVPAHYPFVEGDTLVPLRAGGTIAWTQL
jgi:hypothetical protein